MQEQAAEMCIPDGQGSMLPIDIYKSSSEFSEHSQGCSCPIHIAPAAKSALLLLLLLLHFQYALVLSIIQQTCVVIKGQIHLVFS